MCYLIFVDWTGGFGLRAQALSALGDAQDPKPVLLQLESPIPEGRLKAQGFLNLIAPFAFPALFRALADTDSTMARKGLLDILGSVNPLPTVVVAEELNDNRWYVVRNAVCLLGHAREDPAAYDCLSRASSYPDERVRREVVRSLSALDDPRVPFLLTRYLDDSASSVRILASRALVGAKARSSAGALEDAIKSRDFSRRSPDEIAAFVDAYSTLAAENAVPLLDELWRKRPFRRARPLTLREAAVSALGRIASTEARASLESAARSGEAIVRTAAERALVGFSRRGEL